MALIVPSSSTGAVRPVRRRNVSLPMLSCFLVVVVATSTVLLPTASAAKEKVEAKQDALDTAREFVEHPLFHAQSRAVSTRQLRDLMRSSPFFGKIAHEDVHSILQRIKGCLDGRVSSLAPKTIIRLKAAGGLSRLHYLSNWLEVKPSKSDRHDALVETLKAQKTIWESDYCKSKLQPGYFGDSSEKGRRLDFIFSFLVHRAFVDWLQSKGLGSYPKALSIFFVTAMRNFGNKKPLKWGYFQSKAANRTDWFKSAFEEVFFSDLRRTVSVNELNRLLRLQWAGLTEDTQTIFKEAKKQDGLEDNMTVEKLWVKQQEGQVEALKQKLLKTIEVFVGYEDQGATLEFLSGEVFAFVTETRTEKADRVTLAATCAATKEGVVNSLNGQPLNQPVVFMAKFNKLLLKKCPSCKAYRLQEALYPPRLQGALKKSTEEAAQLVKEVLPNYCFSEEAIDALKMQKADFYTMRTKNVVTAALGKRPTIKNPSTIFRPFRAPSLLRPWIPLIGPSAAVLLHFLRVSGFVSRTSTQLMKAELNAGLFMVSFLLGDTIQEFLRDLQQSPFYSKEINPNWTGVSGSTE